MLTTSPGAEARALSALVRQNADESERIGTVAPNVVDALRQSGLFWVLLPTNLGGLGSDVTTAMEVFEVVSRADGSTGWSLMANSLSTALAGAYCGDDAIDAMFGSSGGKAITAGMLGPGGECIEVDGGFRGSGLYHFASGAGHADWLAAGMFVIEEGRPRPLANGQPEVRVCVIPRQAVEMRGNWNVMGLVGTGSYDFAVPEQLIDAGFTFERTSIDYLRGGPLFSLGVVGFGCAGHASVALGITARALEEIAGLAAGKKRAAYPSVIGDHPLFLHGFAHHEAAYQGARSYTYQVFGDAQRTVLGGAELSAEMRQRFRQCATYVHTVAAEAVRWCYTWGGSDALRLPSPLGRCLRDMAGATQHVFVDPITLLEAGSTLAEAWRASE